MSWKQLRVDCKAAQAEAIGEALSDFGAHAVSFVDAKDTPQYEPKPGEVMLWPDTQVIGLFDAEVDITLLVALMQQQGLLDPKHQWQEELLADQDWERAWMDNFHPMKFGNRLWICPSWREIPEPNAVNILLDPGLAFGTGTHPTTSLCLTWLDAKPLSGKTFVDYGCGSGVLAVAALKLGAKRGIAVDIDPQALEATLENARRNGVEDRIEVFLPNDTPEFVADYVFANILAGPLVELKDTLYAHCKPGGEIVISGILKEQCEALTKAYVESFSLGDESVLGEWARLSGVRSVKS